MLLILYDDKINIFIKCNNFIQLLIDKVIKIIIVSIPKKEKLINKIDI